MKKIIEGKLEYFDGGEYKGEELKINTDFTKVEPSRIRSIETIQYDAG